MDSIEIETEITVAARDEALALIYRKDSWPRRLLEYYVCAFGVAQAAFIDWYAVRAVIGYVAHPTKGLAAFAGFLFSIALIALPVAVVVWLVRKEKARRRVLKSMLGPTRFSMTPEGILYSEPGGKSALHEWETCEGFYVGHRALLCLGKQHNGFMVIPTETVSDGGLAEIRSYVSGHIKEFSPLQLREWVAKK